MTNYRNRHINPFITLLLGGLLFLLGACDSFNYEPMGEESSSNCRVRLYVSLMGGQSRDLSTRAQWDTPGVDFENYLDISDFQVYIFGADDEGSEDGKGKLLAHLTDPAVKDAVELKIERANDYNDKYTITFRVDAVIEDAEEVLKNFKIVMLANWDNVYPTVKIGETTIDGMTSDLEKCVAQFEPTKPITKMPFFGVQEYSDVQLQSENVNTLQSVHLLRAFAKIEVYDDPATELKLVEGKGVKLKRYNTKFFKAPLHTTESSYKDNAPELSLVDNYETTSEEDGEIDITPDSRGHYIIYVPEYKNIDRSDDKKSSLLLTFEDGKEFTVDFKYYQKPASEPNAEVGQYYDLRRNYWYEIIVKRTPILDVQVDVLPYTSVELKPNFGLLLDNLTLNKYVSKLYTDPQASTRSQDILIAYDENNNQITDGKVNWRLSESVATHVCTITKNEDGTCTVKPIENATGRDVVEAVILDKKGFEVIAECIIEVTERHLGLEKTFLGLIPKDILPAYSFGSFRVNIVAERDENSTLSWKLLDTNDQQLSADPEELVTVTAEGDGGVLNSGDKVSEKNITINVQANGDSKLGEVHLMLTYTGPDPYDSAKRRDYTTYCDISVSNVSLTVYPTVLQLTVGQQSSVTARTAPVFSDYIPSLSFESSNTGIVTVDDNGLVTAVGEGKTRIKVFSNDDLLNWIDPQYVDVEVAPDDLILLRYDGSPADHVELLSGEKLQLRAFSHGEDVSKTAVWDVVDVSFLEKIENGVLTAGSKPGTSTVRATYTVNGISYSETCVVTVADERKLLIADCPKGISPNASVPMRAYVFPDSVSYDKRNYTVTWTSSDVNIIAFDDPTDKSIAVAKNPGTATITATTEYNGVSLTAETEIGVLGHDQDIEPELLLYIKDSTGKKFQLNTDYIKIPEGETWTAEVDFTDGLQEPSINCTWDRDKPETYYDWRVTPTPSSDTKSCKITAGGEYGEDGKYSQRYNFVTLSFEYKNVKYT